MDENEILEENIKREREKIDELAKDFANSFTTFTDIEGVIIRGHILVEQHLSRAIENTVLRPEEYRADKFTFAQKLHIANMLGISTILKNELSLLNSLRNQIAHSLNYKEKHVVKIIEMTKAKHREWREDLPLNIGLRRAISFMCGYISMSHNLAKSAYENKILIDKIQCIQAKRETEGA
ncbi:MAG: hypothetical protein KIB51_10905 [Dysgonomonas mossii]|nr:hypothetical protein [Dysgonomonas mossii]